MADCLVTKLKGVVDNDSLLKFGETVFNVVDSTKAPIMEEKYADYRRHFFAAKNTVNYTEGAIAVYPRCEIVGDGYFLKGQTLATAVSIGKVIADGYVPNDGKIFLSDGNYTLKVSDKYTIKHLMVSNWMSIQSDISILKYMSGLDAAFFTENYFWNGDLVETANTLPTGNFWDTIRLGPNAVLDLDKVTKLWPFRKTTIAVESPDITLDLSKLPLNNGRIINWKHTTGSIEGMRDICRSFSPGIDGSVIFDLEHDHTVTYQGSVIPYYLFTAQWDAEGNITITQGE